MKKILYPKMIFPTLKLFFIIATFAMLIFTILKLIEKSSTNDFGELLFPAIFFFLFIGYFAFHLTYFFCFYFKYVIIGEKTFSIFELIKLKSTKVEFNKIKGYSKSEIYFGRYNWKSESIVIYFENEKTSEIVKAFVYNIDILEKELKNKKVKYLGFEHYNTGWFYRKYKFMDK